jgi:hypothetical protein
MGAGSLRREAAQGCTLQKISHLKIELRFRLQVRRWSAEHKVNRSTAGGTKDSIRNWPYYRDNKLTVVVWAT